MLFSAFEEPTYTFCSQYQLQRTICNTLNQQLVQTHDGDCVSDKRVKYHWLVPEPVWNNNCRRPINIVNSQTLLLLLLLLWSANRPSTISEYNRMLPLFGSRSSRPQCWNNENVDKIAMFSCCQDSCGIQKETTEEGIIVLFLVSVWFAHFDSKTLVLTFLADLFHVVRYPGWNRIVQI